MALLHIVIDTLLNVVCNSAMSKEIDRQLIVSLGGPTQVAELLNLPKYGGVQRVQNWINRGIPSAVKVKYPHIFMPELTQSPANAARVAADSIANTAV